MALATSGALSLNQIHVEAGGSSGTTASLNDTDIRGLTAASGRTINSTQGTEIDFADFYGASNIVQYSATITTGLQTFIKATYHGFYADPSPNIIFNPMGTLNGSTSGWSPFGGISITGITTQTATNTGNQHTLQINGGLTTSSFTSITYQSTVGTVTIPSSSFTTVSAGVLIQVLNAEAFTNGAGHISNNSTVTITV